MDIVQEATNDYHHRVNEGTLRAHTEHPLFSRFRLETEWFEGTKYKHELAVADE